jgi:hypothetical protein
MTHHPNRSAIPALPASTRGPDAAQAIEFAIAIEDHHGRVAFLQAWQHGDTSEWPEYQPVRNVMQPCIGDVIVFFPDVRAELHRIADEQKTTVSSLVNGMCALWLRD